MLSIIKTIIIKGQVFRHLKSVYLINCTMMKQKTFEWYPKFIDNSVSERKKRTEEGLPNYGRHKLFYSLHKAHFKFSSRHLNPLKNQRNNATSEPQKPA